MENDKNQHEMKKATAATVLFNLYKSRSTNGVVVDENIKPAYVHVDSGQDVEDIANALEMNIEVVLAWHAKTLAEKGTFEGSDFAALVDLGWQ